MRTSTTGFRWRGFFYLMAIWGATGCATSPHAPAESGYRYAPEPALVEIFHHSTTQEQQTPLSVLVSVTGVRQGDTSAGNPATIDVRMRLEDHGPATVDFDPKTAQLVTGSLQSFGAPRSQPVGPLHLTTGQTEDVTLSFPFPAGASPQNTDVGTLRLRWLVQIDNHHLPQTAYFERASPLYYDAR